MAERRINIKLYLDGKEFDAQIARVGKATEDTAKKMGNAVEQQAEPKLKQYGMSVNRTAYFMSMAGMETGKFGAATQKAAGFVQMMTTTGFNPYMLALMGVTAAIAAMAGAFRGVDKDLEDHKKRLEELKTKTQEYHAAWVEAFNEGTSKTAGNLKVVQQQLANMKGSLEEARQYVSDFETMVTIPGGIPSGGFPGDIIAKYTKDKKFLERAESEYNELLQQQHDLQMTNTAQTAKAVGPTHEQAEGQRKLNEQLEKANQLLWEKVQLENEMREASGAGKFGSEGGTRSAASADWDLPMLAEKVALKEADKLAEIRNNSWSEEIQAEQAVWQQRFTNRSAWLDSLGELERENAERRMDVIQNIENTAAEQRIKHELELNQFLAESAAGLTETIITAGLEGSTKGLIKAIGAQLKQYAIMALVRSAMEIAEAVSCLAGVYTAALAPGHFAAAAKWAAVGAIAGSFGAAMSSAGGGGGGPMTTPHNYVTEPRQQGEGGKQELTIAVYGAAYFGQDADRAIYESVKRYERSQNPGSTENGL